MNINRQKLRQFVETIFWISIVMLTILICTQLPVEEAKQMIQNVLFVTLATSIYFYLSSKVYYKQNMKRTKELERKQIEISDKEKTLDLIMNHASEGILILDNEQRIETFSPGMEKISGYSKEESLGRNAQILLKFQSQKSSSLLPDLMFTDTQIKKDKPYVTNSLLTKDGKRIDIEASYTLIKGSEDDIKSLAIIRNVDFEKALTERDKEFIAVTSHQLNTPLSIIRGYSALLLKNTTGKLNKKQKEFVNEINQSTAKMITLTNNLLSISRIEQEKIKLNLEDVNVADMIQKLEQFIKPKAISKKINFKISKIDKNLIILADAEKLSQAISNLLDNAIKYTEKGFVELKVISAKNLVTFKIIDTGIGISKSDLEKVGDKFYRSQNAINIDNKGTGLGIFIAKTIVEKHQGHFKIESEINKGTKITFTIPNNQKSKINLKA